MALITWFWVHKKHHYPGWSGTNQVSLLKEGQGPSPKSERFFSWSWRNNLPCYEMTMEAATDQGSKDGLRSCEWSLNSSKLAIGELSPNITSYWIFPTNTWAHKESLSSRKEGSLADAVIAHLWYSKQRTPLGCAGLPRHENNEVMNVYVVSKLINLG